MNRETNNTRTFRIVGSVPEIWRNYPLWLGAAVIGVVAYLLGLSSRRALELFADMRASHPWWPFLTLPVGGAALTWFMRRVGPGTEGSGIQQAVAAIHIVHHEQQIGALVNLRLAAAKFLAIVFGTGSGFVLGIEGPTVQIGASIMYAFRRLYPFSNPALRGQLIMAGGAAGIAAAFNAPMAGLMFAFEELGKAVSWHASARVMLSVILAGTVAFGLRGNVSFFDNVDFFRQVPFALLAILLAVTVAGAAMGSAFAWLAIRTNRWLPESVRRFRSAHPYRFAVACALLIAVVGLAAPIFGSGVEETGAVLRGEAVFSWLYAPCKLVGLLLTLLIGVPGGVFAPSLALGAGVGCWFTALGAPEWHSAIIAIGMVSCLSAVTRAPLTAAIIIAEMTAAHEIMLVAMGASLLSAHLSRFTHVRFYHDLAGRALKGLAHKRERVSIRGTRRAVRKAGPEL